jgi:hypothetical protein
MSTPATPGQPAPVPKKPKRWPCLGMFVGIVIAALVIAGAARGMS